MTETKLQKLSRQFIAGEIDKFDFYIDTINYTAKQVAEASGVDIEIVKDRRSYMRELIRQSKEAKKVEAAPKKETTTIQVSRESAAALNEVGDVMCQIFPDLFTSNAPTKDAVVGFLVGHFMGDLTDNDIAELRTAWAERQAARN